MSQREELYNLLKETFLLLDDGDRQLFNQFDLTPPRFYALFHIGEEPGISSSDLSDRMLCDKSNVTRIVKSLEANDYIERQPHETDGRTLRLYLTKAGEEICNEVHTAHQQYNAQRLNCIDLATQGNLLESLSTLNQFLQQELAQQILSDNGHNP